MLEMKVEIKGFEDPLTVRLAIAGFEDPLIALKKIRAFVLHAYSIGGSMG